MHLNISYVEQSSSPNVNPQNKGAVWAGVTCNLPTVQFRELLPSIEIDLTEEKKGRIITEQIYYLISSYSSHQIIC